VFFSLTRHGCTLADTAGSGVYASGSSNVITRNQIYNTDYSGTSACGIALHGNREIVTFNTASNSGRDILLPLGTGSDIRFNDLSHPGLLCKGTGAIYVVGVNAQGAAGPPSRLAFNWIHDIDYPPTSTLICLANYAANFVVDHNEIWNSGGDEGILIVAPAVGHQIYNNTLFNCANLAAYTNNVWPSNNPDASFWTNNVCQYSASNNLYLAFAPQAQLVNWTQEEFQLQPNAPAIDAGVVIPGFTEGYLGQAPDLGAYEYGGLTWSAGVGSTPTLAITGLGGGIVTLTASPDAAYYQLYSATNLTPPALWQPVTNVPTASGYEWALTLPLSATGPYFYRLQGL